MPAILSMNGHHQPEEEAYWWQNPDEPDEWYKIRPLYGEIQDRLMAKHTKPNRFGIGQLHRPKYFYALYDYLIVEWEGVFADHERTIPIECTADAKYVMFCQLRRRADMIHEEAERLAEDAGLRKEAAARSFRRAPAAPAELSKSGLSDL